MIDLIITGWSLLVEILPDALALGVKLFGAAILAWLFIHSVWHAPEGARGPTAAGLAIAIVTCGYEAARWLPSSLPLQEIYPLTRATLDGMEKLLIVLLPVGLMHYWAAPAWSPLKDIGFSVVSARVSSLLAILAISLFLPVSIALQGEMQSLSESRLDSLERLSEINVARQRTSLESLLRTINNYLEVNIKHCKKYHLDCPTHNDHRKQYNALAAALGFKSTEHLQGSSADLGGAEALVTELYKSVFGKDAKLPQEAQSKKVLADPKAAPTEIWKRLRQGVIGDFVTPLSGLLVAAHWSAFLLLVAAERRRKIVGVAR